MYMVNTGLYRFMSLIGLPLATFIGVGVLFGIFECKYCSTSNLGKEELSISD